MALTTKSASGSVATFTVPGEPDATSMLCASPTFFSLLWRWSADSSDAMDTIFGRQRRACSNARSTFPPAARLTTEKRSGNASTIFSVLLPMEPVEPRMAMRFMGDTDYGNARLRLDAGEISAQTGQVENHPHRQG